VTIADANIKVNVLKGDRIRASWLAVKPVCLAGVQPKLGGEVQTVTGVIRHIRCDDPMNPTEIRIYVDPDGEWTGSRVTPFGCECPTAHVEIQPEWVEAKI
jgi:hypothetical protein